MARSVEFNECEKIEKALNVFREKGYHATSMQDLVDAMQINRSSLYNTIGDKHDLFMKCITSYTDGVICEARKRATKEGSAFKALLSLIRDKATWIVDCEKGCLGMKTIFEVAPEDIEVRNVLNNSFAVFNELLTGLIQRAIDDGDISAEEDPEIMAEYIGMSFTGWKQSYILQGNPIKIKKMAEYLIKSISKQ
jgi:TetR/AcrR family transcriptional repressor of nem operon